MINTPIRLYDVGNTLLTMDHASYVFGRAPSLRTAYEQGDTEANFEYESILCEGLEQGLIRVEALPGVAQKLASNQERGIGNAVFSTCLSGAIDAALQQTNVASYIHKVFSTFFYNSPTDLDLAKQTAAIKTVEGFRTVQAALQGQIISYADDKAAELRRAHEGLEGAVHFYRIGQPSLDDASWMNPRNGIVEIPDLHSKPWKRAHHTPRPRPV